MKIEDHPSVRALRRQTRSPAPSGPLDADELRSLCLECGADDVGFVRLSDPLLEPDRSRILEAFPGADSLIAICCRMPVENVRSTKRSFANQAFHATGHEVDEVCRRIVLALSDRGVRACNPSMGFPMEVGEMQDRAWVVSHKLVAEAAGLGVRGLHRSVIHPKFGSFILLGTVLIDRPVTEYSQPLDYNPCVSCKLCVAACPVGAIQSDGHFDASACLTHNYREFMGGFTDWVETVASSGTVAGYRAKVEDGETLSMWQSLSYGANYKAAYCLAVCPAGEDVLGGFLDSRPEHLRTIVRPLQEKVEPVYVVPGSDAEAYTRQKYPHKRLRQVRSGVRPVSVASFLQSIPWLFQRGQSEGLNATYHFIFSGDETKEATVVIRDRRIEVQNGLQGTADVTIRADSKAWVKFLRHEWSLFRLLVTRALQIRPLLRGVRLLAAFGRCFPS
ncbi:MAG: SCP2 sterol-binding domain-containing protein [Planctomycetaceae bacterium]|nr:SCP2 sterol-binding domain-containing protein [Planctomycetaceae bacterium]